MIDELQPPICVFHIAKTGGTYLRNVAKRNEKYLSGRTLFLNHRSTLFTTSEEYGSNRKFAFVFRNPEERFVSAFYSRLRNGRPTNSLKWSSGEAVAFMYFRDPNSLAEALYTEDDRMRSAAIFAMESIVHIGRNYSFYFGNTNLLFDNIGNLSACIELDDLTRNLTGFMKLLGYSEVESKPASPLHTNRIEPVELTDLAKTNLKKFWVEDFKIYDFFKAYAEVFQWEKAN